MKSKTCSFFVACWTQFASLHCILLLSLTLIGELGYSQSEYRFQHYDTRDGLPSDDQGALVQDSLGYMWVLGAGGLSRFDGYTFKSYKYNPDYPEKSLDKAGLYSIWTDRSRNLWGTRLSQNPYILSRYDRKTDGFIKQELDLTGSSWVRKVLAEKNGTTLWFASRLGLFSFHPETKQIEKYLNIQGDSLSSLAHNDIQDIVDRDSVLLIASLGLWKFDKMKKTFSRADINSKDFALLSNIVGFYEGPDLFEGPYSESKELWILYDAGLAKLDEHFSVVHRFDLPSDMAGPNAIDVTGFARDLTGVFWIATDGNGLCRYNPLDSSFIRIKSNPQDPYSLRSDHLNCVTVDRDQNVWVSSNRGISRLSRPSLNFYNVSITGGAGTPYKAGGKDYVIRSKSKHDGSLDVMMIPIIRDHLDSVQVHQVVSLKEKYLGADGFHQGKHNLWIITGMGVIGVPINQESGMIEPGSLKIFKADRYNPITYFLFNSFCAWEDSDENLWVSGYGGTGLNKIIPGIPFGTKGSVIQYLHSDLDSASIGNNDVSYFYSNDQKSIWVITGTGVDRYSNNRFEHVFENKEKPTAVYQSRDGILYVGTMGGLYEGTRKGGQYRINKLALLKNNHVTGIDEDLKGRLWISTILGIIVYDRNEKIAIEFNRKDGYLHGGIPHHTSQGTMVTSGDRGFSIFDPLSLRISKGKVLPRLTRLTINNELPDIGTNKNRKDKLSIAKDISVLNNLVLDYQHNNFAIEFSGMEMTAPEKNLYRHKLEGYDNDWIETDWKNRTATYTNLDAGDYTFKVSASNHHGIWSDQEATLVVRILPPPWKTWWAYTLYGMALLGIFLSLRRYDINRVKLKHRARHLGELDILKSRFFANISHEFRTPITLIIGPLKDLYQKTSEAETKAVLGPVIRNSQRLIRLINQLLDLSKLEAGKMGLQASQTELVQFLKEIASSYESLASHKKLKYLFYPEVQELIAYIDQEKVEKIVHNLLSNAFKFTNEGEVILYLKVEGNHAMISVKDSGIGIPSTELDKVFDRFYQVDSSQTRKYEGSGLGMALAKELVELHHGNISVESIEGKGATFKVLIPLGKAHLGKGVITGPVEFQKSIVLSDVDAKVCVVEKATVPAEYPVLLIVEDNLDMRSYIAKTLSISYQIIEAVNGNEGVAKAGEYLPDLIISDIMMPEMDGYKLCELIKTNELTSHIPVILLTAKADQQSRLTGLEQRADDYLLKPFDADELKLIVRNRIEARQKMRERFSREITLEPRQISVTSLDEKFLQKVIGLIEAHIEDEDFSIEDFSQEAGYSRMQLYRKLKSLAGQTPSQFVRTIRLKRAAQMLVNKSDNVTQIAYSVGFRSLAYFNKCFREQYGVTPGQFAEADLSNPKSYRQSS